jgi:hypothetical protein
MVFTLYPDPPVAPRSVPAGGQGEAGFAQSVGAPVPEFTGIYERMMFLRVAMIGGSVAPTVFMRAGQGPAVAVVEATQPVFRAIRPDGGGTGFVGDVFLVPGAGNVLRILVGFDRATEETWTLGIRNNDPSAERHFTWVVADSEAETIQPWVDPGSFIPAFADPSFTPAGGASGTSVTLSGRNFHIGMPRVTFGTVPAALLAPPAPGALTVSAPDGFVSPGQPGADLPVSVETAAGTAVASGAFHAVPPAPAFAAPPFAPEPALLGRKLLLHGRNFHFAPVTVEFRALEFFDDDSHSPVPGEVLGRPSATDMTVRIPTDVFVLGPIGKISVTVTTAGGSITCAQALPILVAPPLPTLEDFSPSTVEIGGEVTLNGQDFNVPPVTVTFSVEGHTAVPAVLLEPPAATRIRVTAPALGPEAQNQARIIVRNRFGTSDSAEFITITRPAG